jgi:type II secretory pathway component PulK
MRVAIDERDRRRGVALLLVLLALVLIVLKLAVLVRRSTELALRASREEAALAERHALRSLRRTLARTLPERIERALREAASIHEERERFERPETTLRGAIELGGRRIEFVFADEDARAHLGALLVATGRERAQSAAADLAASLGPIALEPYRESAGVPWPGPFSTLDQVFAEFDPRGQVFESRESFELTVFGKGRLRHALASEEALRAILEIVISRREADAILEYRRVAPLLKVDEFLSVSRLGLGERAKLRLLLADRSECYSLWTRISTRRGRDSIELALLAPGSTGIPETRYFYPR